MIMGPHPTPSKGSGVGFWALRLGVWEGGEEVESWWRRYMLKNKKTKIGKRLISDGANIINEMPMV